MVNSISQSIYLSTITSVIERVQALADISRSAQCCHSNETRAPIANPPIMHTRGTPTIPRLHPGPCSNVEMRRRTDTQTDTHTDARNQYTFRLGYATREM